MSTNYRLWEHIFRCLVDEASCFSNESRGKNAAFQIAFCYKVGFGISADKSKATHWLKKGDKTIIDLENEIRMVKADKDPIFKSLESEIDTMDYANEYRQFDRLDYVQQVYDAAATNMDQTLGKSHPISLHLNGILASIMTGQGDYKGANNIFLKTTKIYEEALGREDPSTLTSMSNLASAFWNQGRWKEAEELEVQVVEARKRVLGAEHLDTLKSMANLASTYRNQGRWKEAEELFVQVMETFRRVLGAEHRSTLTSMTNLASMYRTQGQWKEAEELQSKELDICRRVL
jgi:tetratricopeptide (TPR) repeat protein